MLAAQGNESVVFSRLGMEIINVNEWSQRETAMLPGLCFEFFERGGKH